MKVKNLYMKKPRSVNPILSLETYFWCGTSYQYIFHGYQILFLIYTTLSLVQDVQPNYF